MTKIPHCDELVQRFLDRWADERSLKRRGFQGSRPDMMRNGAYVGCTEAEASPLAEDTQAKIREQIAVMTKAAQTDWPRYLDVSGEIDIGWVAKFDQYYDRKRVAEVIARSDEKDFSNDYLVICCEFGAVLGRVCQSRLPRLIWHLEWPYWESAILDPITGYLVPVFHWAVGKMSDYSVDDGYVGKLDTCLGILTKEGRNGEVA